MEIFYSKLLDIYNIFQKNVNMIIIKRFIVLFSQLLSRSEMLQNKRLGKEEVFSPKKPLLCETL